ncbi:hypothetical protein [Xenorhabdus siamensis]|uniref:hypothetical protein n=1 Tax=Xenorhabdus siamensis TaxID=3136254 RepID=UPI0030F42217
MQVIPPAGLRPVHCTYWGIIHIQRNGKVLINSPMPLSASTSRLHTPKHYGAEITTFAPDHWYATTPGPGQMTQRRHTDPQRRA